MIRHSHVCVSNIDGPLPMANSTSSRCGFLRGLLLLRAAFLTLLTIIMSSTLFAQDPAADFRTNCMSCHTIGGGRLTGPDLKNVTQRKDRAWLTTFIQDPKSVIDAGDPYAQELMKASRGVVMPTLPAMTRARAEALLSLIEAESKLEKSQFAGVQISERPFTPRDVEVGHGIFMGTVPLKNGGPSCISCHTVHAARAASVAQAGMRFSTSWRRRTYIRSKHTAPIGLPASRQSRQCPWSATHPALA